MSIYITQRPQAYLDPGLTALSKWHCSWLPAIFEFYRKDVTVIAVDVDISDNMTIELPDNADAVGIQVGDEIYLSSTNYDTYGFVTATSGGGGSNVIITTDIPYTINATGGYINLISTRVGYFLEVNINGWNVSPTFNRTSGAFELFSTIKLFPDRTGKMTADVSKHINKIVQNNIYILEDRNKLDTGQGSWYYLSHVERWSGSSEDVIIDGGVGSETLAYYVSAVKQLGQTYGNNLAEYVPFNLSALSPKALFLSDFNKPTYFPGFPFMLNFIYSEQLAGLSITIEQDYFNEAGSTTGHQDNDIITSQLGGVNGLAIIGQLPTDTGGLAIPTGTKEIDVWLEIGGADGSGYVEEGYYVSGYTVETAPSSITPFRFTEKKRVKISDKTCGLLIAWKGTKGNWNYWLFNDKYDINTNSGSELVREVYNADVAPAQSLVDVVRARKQSSLTVFDRVLAEDLTGIETIEQSRKILLYDTTRESKWIQLIYKPKSLRRGSYQSLVPVEMTFDLPELNTEG